jgi:uncharacterized protein (DUF58 family)
MDDAWRRALAEGELAGSGCALAAPRHAPLGRAGIELGRRAGSSLEFRDHREYQPGDDLRHLDWGAYARSDRLIVKLFREEVHPHADILLDGSRSMALPDTAKARAAVGLAAALAAAAASSAFTHAVWLAGDGCAPLPHGSERPSAWEGIAFDSARSPAEALAAAPPRWRPRGIRILVSDLLWPGDPQVVVETLARGAAAAAVVQVLAAADLEPPARGNLRLVDHETEAVKEVFVDAAAERRYRETLERHQEGWREAARRWGAALVTVTAEEIAEGWNLGSLAAAEVLTVV